MTELLRDPLVQWGALPFAAGFIAAAILWPLRLAGLAAAAGVAAAVAVTGGFALEPLTVVRKIIVAGAAAAVLGALADLAFKPTRVTGLIVGALFAGVTLWVFAAILLSGLALLAAPGSTAGGVQPSLRPSPLPLSPSRRPRPGGA